MNTPTEGEAAKLVPCPKASINRGDPISGCPPALTDQHRPARPGLRRLIHPGGGSALVYDPRSRVYVMR